MSCNNRSNFSRFLIVFHLFFTICFSLESLDPDLLPRPLLIEYGVADNLETHLKELNDEIRLQCTSWRFSAEANNLNPWRMIPEECLDYVTEYMAGRGYGVDLEMVSRESLIHAKSVELVGDGKDVWVFDVDETLLSNLPYYADHGFGSEMFNHSEFDKWVEKAIAPAIESSLTLYRQLLDSGFKLVLLTGRSQNHSQITIDNLINVGFQDWHTLILRSPEDVGKSATLYKSEKRSEMEKEGYRIHGNSGDQWSDLLGHPMSSRSFKLPNPMYYIP